MNYVPVFDDLAVFKPEYIHHRRPPVLRIGFGKGVNDHIVAISKDLFEFRMVVRQIFFGEGEEVFQAFGTVSGQGIMLNIDVALRRW